MQKSEDRYQAIFNAGVSIALGSTIGMIITLLLLYLTASLVYSGRLNESISDTIVLAAAFVSSCIGSVITIKRQRRSIMVFGGVGGAAYFVLILVCAAFGGSGGILWSNLLKVGICAIMGGLLAGAACLPKRTRSKSRRSK